jgi:hypothetical protein
MNINPRKRFTDGLGLNTRCSRFPTGCHVYHTDHLMDMALGRGTVIKVDGEQAKIQWANRPNDPQVFTDFKFLKRA